MRSKSFLLLICAILAVGGYFSLPANRSWIQYRVLDYGKDFLWQRHRTDEEFRKLRRYKEGYVISMEIAKQLKEKGAKPDALVLLPSTAYFKQNSIEYPVPEPAVFYYFTGLKTVWAESPEASTATWYVRAAGGKVVADSVPFQTAFLDSIRFFRKYPSTL